MKAWISSNTNCQPLSNLLNECHGQSNRFRCYFWSCWTPLLYRLTQLYNSQFRSTQSEDPASSLPNSSSLLSNSFVSCEAAEWYIAAVKCVWLHDMTIKRLIFFQNKQGGLLGIVKFLIYIYILLWEVDFKTRQLEFSSRDLDVEASSLGSFGVSFGVELVLDEFG